MSQAATSHRVPASVASGPVIALVNSDRVAQVDECDLTMLTPHRWYLASNGYAKRVLRWRGIARTQSVYMHRQILGVPPGVYVDHINHDVLDNRRANLRACTMSQQLGNQYARSGTSKFKGVYQNRRGGWHATIRFQRKTQHLGSFSSETEAARAYDVAALAFFGRFALLNFPLPDRLARVLAVREEG